MTAKASNCTTHDENLMAGETWAAVFGGTPISAEEHLKIRQLQLLGMEQALKEGIEKEDEQFSLLLAVEDQLMSIAQEGKGSGYYQLVDQSHRLRKHLSKHFFNYKLDNEYLQRQIKRSRAEISQSQCTTPTDLPKLKAQNCRESPGQERHDQYMAEPEKEASPMTMGYVHLQRRPLHSLTM
jgi:hypothetical protein